MSPFFYKKEKKILKNIDCAYTIYSLSFETKTDFIKISQEKI